MASDTDDDEERVNKQIEDINLDDDYFDDDDIDPLETENEEEEEREEDQPFVELSAEIIISCYQIIKKIKMMNK